ncbi:MAG: lactate dehydrogenase [Fimbriimonadales bacterium]|nr:MAG: lactate dehydrogenase [Fimbriimonadales bacterium]
MKVGIIGGGGRVGSNAAFTLQLIGAVSEVVLLDVNREAAEGEALDLRHGAAYSQPVRFHAGDYADLKGASLVIITAGLRRRPDESRLELINRNVGLFREILSSVKGVQLADDAILLVVSNPVDILTYLAVQESGLPAARVIGLGTVLDTCRFRSFLAEYFGVAATDVDALILGEHGDSMVPAWSCATIAGVPIRDYPNYSQEAMDAVFERTKNSGAEAIRLKGGAGYAVGVSIAQVVNAIALDKQQILPVSTLQTGALGIRDVCFSLPTRVGRKGVEAVIEIGVSDEERNALQTSASVLKETLGKVMP